MLQQQQDPLTSHLIDFFQLLNLTSAGGGFLRSDNRVKHVTIEIVN